MLQYQYQLEKSSKKHICPLCRKKRFVRYIDIHSHAYLPEKYGRCDREANCGHHINPYEDGYHKNKKDYTEISKLKPPKPIKKSKPIFYPHKIFENTRQDYEINNFIINLLENVPYPFEAEDIEKIIAQYHLGTITKGYRKGAVTFPFIDINCNVRTVQVKQFDKENHTTGTDFLHSMIERDLKYKNKIIPEWLQDYNNQDTKVSCFFGEHLLRKYPDNPIALVEAPKTAVYNTLYFGCPKNTTNYLWLAVYNLSSLSFEKCKVLKGRDVYLFPDLSNKGTAFNLWSTKAEEYENKIPGTSFKTSDLLEKLAPAQDREQGKDIADYLIELDWRDFRSKEAKSNNNELPETQEQPYTEVNNNTEVKKIEDPFVLDEIKDKTSSAEDKTEDWSKEIKDLENFFSNTELPKGELKLNNFSTILECSKYVESHLNVIKVNMGNKTFKPYRDRLIELKNYLLRNNADK